MNRIWWKRAALTIALIVTTASVGVGAAPSPAAATANVCTSISGVPGDHMCTRVVGSGTHVEYARPAVYRVNPQSICNYYATFTVYNSAGTKIYTATSAYHKGCLFAALFASRQINVYRSFPNNSRACGSWFQDGGRLGTACATLHS